MNKETNREIHRKSCKHRLDSGMCNLTNILCTKHSKCPNLRRYDKHTE